MEECTYFLHLPFFYVKKIKENGKLLLTLLRKNVKMLFEDLRTIAKSVGNFNFALVRRCLK